MKDWCLHQRSTGEDEQKRATSTVPTEASMEWKNSDEKKFPSQVVGKFDGEEFIVLVDASSKKAVKAVN